METLQSIGDQAAGSPPTNPKRVRTKPAPKATIAPKLPVGSGEVLPSPDIAAKAEAGVMLPLSPEQVPLMHALFIAVGTGD